MCGRQENSQNVSGEVPDSAGTLLLWKTLPTWFPAITLIIYTSGAIIVAGFMSQFGISVNDFLRIRYIYVGLLFSGFPLMLSLFCCASYLFKHKKAWLSKEIISEDSKDVKNVPLRWYRSITTLVLWFDILIFYLAMLSFCVLYGRNPNPNNARPFISLIIFAGLVIFCISKFSLGDNLVLPRQKLSQILIYRLIPPLVLAVLIFLSKKDDGFQSFKPVFVGLFKNWYFRCFIVLFILGGRLISTFYKWRRKIEEDEFKAPKDKKEKSKRALWLGLVFILLPLYCIAAITFQRSVFLYIPATIGGGDYSISHKVVLSTEYSSDTLSDVIRFLQGIEGNYWATKPLVLIDKTSDEIIVADPCDYESFFLRKTSSCRVISIDRKVVKSIRYEGLWNFTEDFSKK